MGTLTTTLRYICTHFCTGVATITQQFIYREIYIYIYIYMGALTTTTTTTTTQPYVHIYIYTKIIYLSIWAHLQQLYNIYI